MSFDVAFVALEVMRCIVRCVPVKCLMKDQESGFDDRLRAAAGGAGNWRPGGRRLAILLFSLYPCYGFR